MAKNKNQFVIFSVDSIITICNKPIINRAMARRKASRKGDQDAANEGRKRQKKMVAARRAAVAPDKKPRKEKSQVRTSTQIGNATGTLPAEMPVAVFLFGPERVGMVGMLAVGAELVPIGTKQIPQFHCS